MLIAVIVPSVASIALPLPNDQAPVIVPVVAAAPVAPVAPAVAVVAAAAPAALLPIVYSGPVELCSIDACKDTFGNLDIQKQITTAIDTPFFSHKDLNIIYKIY